MVAKQEPQQHGQVVRVLAGVREVNGLRGLGECLQAYGSTSRLRHCMTSTQFEK